MSFVCTCGQIAFLLLQQDLLTISIRAHGRESSLGVLWWRSWRQMRTAYIKAKAMMQHDVQDKSVSSLLFVREGTPPLMPVLSLSHLLNSGCCAESEDREWQTHREVSVEVVFPVKKWLLVYGAVESQSCHHRCLDTSFVQDLGTHRDIIWWPGKAANKKQQVIFVRIKLNNTYG